jgi:hypothetical protein
VLDPSGERVALVELPEVAANLCFGGADRWTLRDRDDLRLPRRGACPRRHDPVTPARRVRGEV